MVLAGQIIIVNGTSGSGKSTTCEWFAKNSDQFWLLYGIDQFMGSTLPRQFGHHGARSAEGIQALPLDADEPEGTLRWQFSEMGMQAFTVFHEWIAAASRQGCNIIVDHLMMMDPPLLQDCIWRLYDLPVLFVTLKPPYEVLMERISNRQIGNRFANSSYTSEQARLSLQRLERLRPWFYDAVYANPCCDLEIDTQQHTPQAVCQQISARLLQGPGTAFDQLRVRFPRAG